MVSYIKVHLRLEFDVNIHQNIAIISLRESVDENKARIIHDLELLMPLTRPGASSQPTRIHLVSQLPNEGLVELVKHARQYSLLSFNKATEETNQKKQNWLAYKIFKSIDDIEQQRSSDTHNVNAVPAKDKRMTKEQRRMNVYREFFGRS